MGEEIIENIKKVICRLPDNSADEIKSKYNVYIIKSNGEPENITLDTQDEFKEYINSLLKAKGYFRDDETDYATAIGNARTDQFVEAYDPVAQPEKDDELVQTLKDEFKKYGATFDNNPEPEPTPEEEDYRPKLNHQNDEDDIEKGSILKKAAAITGATAVIAGGVMGISNLINNAVTNEATKEDNFDLDNASIEQIIDQLEDDSLAKTEYQKALNFCEKFNQLASQSNNFRMASDGDNYLEITAEEALYTSIVVNNYSADQISEIFGARGLDYNQVMNGYRSVCDKISIYNMNAKVSSGLDSLINDSTAKGLYHNQEQEVINFNNSVKSDSLDKEKADHVLAITKNNFININAADNVDPAAAYLSSMPTNGYTTANANNPEALMYSGSIDGLDMKKGEQLTDLNKQINDKNYLEKVQANTKNAIDEYNAKISTKLSDSKQKLVSALKDNGSAELAAKVNSRTDLTDLSEEIKKEGGDISDMYDKYQETVDGLNPSGIPADAIISAINQETTTGKSGNLEILKNNRIRAAYEKEDTKAEETIETLDESKNNSASSTTTSNNSTSQNNDTSNNRADEKVEIIDNEEFIDQSNEGIEDAHDYANTPGAYKYDGKIQNKYMDEPYTAEYISQLTPSQLWKEMAMAGISLPDANDEQIQEALNNAAQGKGESYKEGWLLQIKTEISMSAEQAKDTLAENENLYNDALNEVEQLNQVAHAQGDNLTEEQASATATVVTDEEVEQLDLYQTSNIEDNATATVVSDTTNETNSTYNSEDADIDAAATRLVDANMSYDYSDYDSYTIETTTQKTR